MGGRESNVRQARSNFSGSAQVCVYVTASGGLVQKQGLSLVLGAVVVGYRPSSRLSNPPSSIHPPSHHPTHTPIDPSRQAGLGQTGSARPPGSTKLTAAARPTLHPLPQQPLVQSPHAGGRPAALQPSGSVGCPIQQSLPSSLAELPLPPCFARLPSETGGSLCLCLAVAGKLLAALSRTRCG